MFYGFANGDPMGKVIRRLARIELSGLTSGRVKPRSPLGDAHPVPAGGGTGGRAAQLGGQSEFGVGSYFLSRFFTRLRGPRHATPAPTAPVETKSPPQIEPIARRLGILNYTR